jgi:tetratricopeptide (TPR) repeat protein
VRLGNQHKAKDYFEKALKISMELGFPEDIFKPAKGLYEIHKSKGNYKEALEMFQLYNTMKDSSEKKKQPLAYRKELVQNSDSSDQYLQQDALAESQKSVAILKDELDSKSTWIYSLSVLLALCMALIVYLFLSKRG